MIKLIASILAIAIGAAAIYGFFNKQISDEKLEKLIVKRLVERFDSTGFPYERVSATCPEDVKVEKGDKFQCKASVDGHVLTISAEQMDDEGSVSWEVTGGLEALGMGLSAQKLVGSYIANNLGVQEAKVVCPDEIELKKGTTFDCSSEIDGVPVVATVEQQDDKGNVSFTLSSGVIAPALLEAEIEKGLLAKTSTPVEVSCSSDLILSKPGSTIECTGGVPSAPEEGTGKIEVTITDTKGGFEWAVAGRAGASP